MICNPMLFGRIALDYTRAVRMAKPWKEHLLRLSQGFSKEVGELVCKRDTIAPHMGYVAARAFYEMNGGSDRDISHQVGLDGAEIVMFYRIGDDGVDEIGKDLSARVEVIDKYLGVFNGESPNQDTSSLKERAGLEFAGYLHRKYSTAISNAAVNLHDALITQASSQTPRQALSAAKKIGSVCWDTLTDIVEFRLGQVLDGPRQAGKHFGAGMQLLDDLSDINQDLCENIPTFPCLTIQKQGDSPTLRRHIYNTMRHEANAEFKAGLDCLSISSQRAPYQSLVKLLYFSFDVLGPVLRYIKQRQ